MGVEKSVVVPEGSSGARCHHQARVQRATLTTYRSLVVCLRQDETIFSRCTTRAACMFVAKWDHHWWQHSHSLALTANDPSSLALPRKVLRAMTFEADAALEVAHARHVHQDEAGDGGIASLFASWCKRWFGPMGAISGTMRAAAGWDFDITTFAHEIEV